MGFGVWGLGFRVWGLRFRVQGLPLLLHINLMGFQGFRVPHMGDQTAHVQSVIPLGTSETPEDSTKISGAFLN